MLATFNSPPLQHQFLPSIPSPLSPRRRQRRANVKTTTTTFSSTSTSARPSSWSLDTSMATTSQQQPQAQQQLQSQKTPYSSRPIKTAPAPPRADALREQRRNMFLRKVRQSRDDSKWDNRIEDMARLDYLCEKRRWEAEQARSAPPPQFVSSDLPDAEEEHFTYNDNNSHTQLDHHQEIDAVQRLEDQELEALIARMQEDENEQNGRPGQAVHHDAEDYSSSVFGSDDDEYDSIFLDLIDETGGGGGSGVAAGVDQRHEYPAGDMDVEMDLS